MKKKITKFIKIFLIIFVFLIAELIKGANVSADFKNNLGTIIRSSNVAAPTGFSSSAGQSLKYDPDNKFLVFCSTYSHLFNGYNCRLTDDWSEALRAGVAKIIEEANIPNNAITSNQTVSTDLLERNLQVSLAVNALIYNKEEQNKAYWISRYYNPQNYLNDTFKTILRHAEAEYDRIKNNYNVDIQRTTSLNQYYNPADNNYNNPQHIFHITNTNTDNFELKFYILNSALPENLKLKLDFSENNTFNNIIYTKEVTGSFSGQINSDNSVKNLNDYYLRISLVDNRDDKSNTPMISMHLSATGKLNYKIARNYHCSDDINKQTVTPNYIEDVLKIYSDYGNARIKTSDIPDYPNLKIIKENSQHEKLSGAKFKIQQTDNSNSDSLYSKIMTTNSDGVIINEDIEDGDYCITEVTAPDGYLLNETKHCFNVSMETSATTNTLEVTPKPSDDTAINYDQTLNLITITYSDNENSLLINKVDDNNQPIAGAILALKNANGQEIERWTTTTQAKAINKLSKGKYYIEEIQAPDGYITNEKPVVISFTGKETNPKTVTFVNKKNVLNISKVDITSKQELKGARLRILDENCQNVVKLNNENLEWTSGDTVHTIVGLPAGNYCLEETSAPNGYKLMTEKINFTMDIYGGVSVSDNPTDDATVIMNNERYKIYISKRSLTNSDELPGAHLQVLDSNGSVVEEWDSTTEPHLIEMKLPVGTYKLKETIAPSGYILSQDEITFSVDKYGVVTVDKSVAKDSMVIMTNEYNKVYISKQDITNKKELPGAHLTVTDEEGNIVPNGDWVSTEEPHLIEGLAPGTYTITEITSPDGYTRNEESVTFTVDKNGAISGNTIMYNTPTPEVPSTLSTQSVIILIIGILLVGAGAGLYFYEIKKKKAN